MTPLLRGSSKLTNSTLRDLASVYQLPGAINWALLPLSWEMKRTVDRASTADLRSNCGSSFHPHPPSRPLVLIRRTACKRPFVPA
jgi:hypothetical protein